MPQFLHILLKDVRRCWRYLAVVLAMTAVAAALTPKFAPISRPDNDGVNRIVELLPFLLIPAWWFTIVHLVDGEAPVGDRQFWVTRPYSWRSLLAAKLLFSGAFLLLPFLAADCIILSDAGFAPMALIPGLLLRYLWLALVFVLPPFVMACVTRGVRQFVLVWLATIGVFAVAFALQHPQYVPTDSFNRLTETSWLETWGPSLLCIGLGLGVLVWQYALRQTAWARAALLLVGVWGFTSTAWPGGGASPGKAPSDPYPEIAVQFDGARGRIGPDGRSGIRDKVQIDLPIEFTGRSPDLLNEVVTYVSMEPEHGAMWNSHSSTAHRLGSDWVEVNLSPPDFQRLSNQAVTVQVVFGIEAYRSVSHTKVHVGGDWAHIPGFGSIRITQGQSADMIWRAPLVEGTDKLDCTVARSDSVLLYASVVGSTIPGVDPFHFSPVVSFARFFEPVDGPSANFTLPIKPEADCALDAPVALIRRDLRISGIRLADYTAGDSQ